ncbi:MAG: hypothetical protein ABL958_14650 [Bdellovibrionia bacterium]
MKKLISAALAATLWMGSSSAVAAFVASDEFQTLDQSSISDFTQRTPKAKDPGVYQQMGSFGAGLGDDTAFKEDAILRDPSQNSMDSDATK